MIKIKFPLILFSVIALLFCGCHYDFFGGGDLSIQINFPAGLSMSSYKGTVVLTEAGSENPLEETLSVSPSGDRGYITINKIRANSYTCKVTLSDIGSNQIIMEETFEIYLASNDYTLLELQVQRNPSSATGLELVQMNPGDGVYNPAVSIDRLELLMVKTVERSVSVSENITTCLIGFGEFAFAYKREFSLPGGISVSVGSTDNRTIGAYDLWVDDNLSALYLSGAPAIGSYRLEVQDINYARTARTVDWAENQYQFSAPVWIDSAPGPVSAGVSTPLGWTLGNSYSIEKQILFIVPLDGQNGNETMIVSYDRNAVNHSFLLTETGQYLVIIAAVDFGVNHLFLSTDPAEYPDGLVYQILSSMEDNQNIEFIGYDQFQLEVQ